MDTTQNERETALEQLHTIKRFFEEGQQRMLENGVLLMFWGLLIPLANGAFYALAGTLGFNHPVMIAFWPVVSGCGAVVSWIIGSRNGKRSGNNNYALKTSALMWTGFLATALGLFLVQFRNAAEMQPLFLAYIALLLGMAYWIHGAIIQRPWLRVVSAVWWVCAIIIAGMDWFPASTILAACTFLCSFIPGCIMYRSHKKRSA